MEPGKESPLGRVKWQHLAGIYGAIIIVAALALFTPVFQGGKGGAPAVIWVVLGLAIVAVGVLIWMKTSRILREMEDNEATLEKMVGELEKTRQVMMQLNQSARLSETAKSIAFRDADRQALRDAVFDKLQQKDFEAAYEIIDDVAHSAGHTKLAEQLHTQADKYRDATDVERMNQVISNIERLLEEHEWAKASGHIERLIKEYPLSDKALELRQRLADKKEERKKVLLNAWDDAVKRQATDRSLEILRELDQYLTPNEGLALQEGARDVFRTKLHNLGVQFSLAVSGKQWSKALGTGQEIMRDFPNSRMAEEIREKVDILRNKVAGGK